MDSQELVDVQRPRVFYPLRSGVLVTDGWFCAQRHRLAVAEIGDIGWLQSAFEAPRHWLRGSSMKTTGSDLPGRYSEAAWGGRPESVARFTVSLSPKVTMFFGTKAILDNDELSGFTTYCTLGVSLVESPSWIP